MAKQEYAISRGVDVTAARRRELQNSPGGSNAGQYGRVSSENLAGNKCGNPGSYPIDTMERAQSALRLAHNAKNPECIREQVYKKYPSLDPRNT